MRQREVWAFLRRFFQGIANVGYVADIAKSSKQCADMVAYIYQAAVDCAEADKAGKSGK